MEKKKNIVIFVLSIVIVILSVLIVLFATNVISFSDNYDRKEYNNLLSSIQTLFSMKVGPNDYIPLFEPIPMSELEKSDESQTSKDLRVTKEDLEKAGNKFKLFNPEKER